MSSRETLSRTDVALARFGPLVRKGLRFRRQFEDARRAIGAVPFEWYRYDSFPNLFYLQNLLGRVPLSLQDAAAGLPVADIGAADGALSFFLESLGCRVHSIDYSVTNMNGMQGLRRLTTHFRSAIEIHDLDLDGRFELPGRYGLALFLGILYHLKNPFYALETLAGRARYCFLSTWVMRATPGGARIDGMPVAYVLQPAEINGDTTNYFAFSPAGLTVLVQRAGWKILGSLSSGEAEADPITPRTDARMYLLLESERFR